MSKIIVACAVSLGVGFGAGWGLHPAALMSVAPVGVQPAAEFVGAPVAQLTAPSVDLSAMRAMLKEELAAALAGKGGNAQLAPAASSASAETLARRNDAVQAIDGMLASGVWDIRQRRSFEQKVLLLDPSQREHALQQLATGINSGAIRIRAGGQPPM